MRERLSFLPVLLLAGAALVCVGGVRFVLMHGGTARAQGDGWGQEVRLRSFAPGAAARLSVSQGSSGAARVRLTALGLPRPQTLDARARVFVVWAVASGGRAVNLGTLERDERGNGGLEFASPPSLERYSVMVTAEANARAQSPVGPLVLTTRAGEVGARSYGSEANRGEARRSSAPVMAGPNRASSRGDAGGDFYTEVNRALGAGQTRLLTLVGSEIAPRARGRARIASVGGKTFVRARITRLPLPSAVGANIYALWARSPDGRIAYLGSLPATINNTEIYVRTALAFNDFDLFVTAENGRPSLAPTGRRALTTTLSRRLPRRRFWRRRRRPRPSVSSS